MANKNNARGRLANPCKPKELPKQRLQVVLVNFRFKLKAMLGFFIFNTNFTLFFQKKLLSKWNKSKSRDP